LARTPEEAAQQEEQARRLADRAQELLEKASPEERRELERWAEEMRREQQARPPVEREFATETVDARGAEPPAARDERVIAQWFGNQESEPGGAGRAEMGEEVQRAAESAERAIEQQVVPARYSDLVRRVFRRYAERSGLPRGGDRPPRGPGG
jgi:hypothetical protein